MKKRLFCLILAVILFNAGFSQSVHAAFQFTSVTRTLDAFISQYETGVSVYYENLETGYTYAYDANRLYYSASLIKAPYALYLYDQLSDLSQERIYTEDNYRGGGGVIKRTPFETVYTEAELLEYAITHSDNIAFRMLLEAHGTAGFKKWTAERGGETKNLHNLTGANMTLLEAAFFMRLIYEFIETPGENNEKLKKDLLNASFPYIQTPYPFAHKYGLWEAAHHDMGIVYDKSPYILIIMTDRGSSEEPITDETRAIFREISTAVQEVNYYITSIPFIIYKYGLYLY
jgi:hypothetical protein